MCGEMATSSLSEKDILAVEYGRTAWRSMLQGEGQHKMFIKSSRTISGLITWYYHLGHRSLVNQELSHFVNILTEATELGVDGIFKI